MPIHTLDISLIARTQRCPPKPHSESGHSELYGEHCYESSSASQPSAESRSFAGHACHSRAIGAILGIVRGPDRNRKSRRPHLDRQSHRRPMSSHGKFAALFPRILRRNNSRLRGGTWRSPTTGNSVVVVSGSSHRQSQVAARAGIVLGTLAW